MIKGNSYDLYIKLSWGTTEQEQRLCYLNRKKEKQTRKSNFFKLSFVKNSSPSLNSKKKRKKENQLGMKNPLKAGNAPSTFPSNHLLSPASSPFSVSFWLLTVMHLHFLKKKKERKLWEKEKANCNQMKVLHARLRTLGVCNSIHFVHWFLKNDHNIIFEWPLSHIYKFLRKIQKFQAYNSN